MNQQVTPPAPPATGQDGEADCPAPGERPRLLALLDERMRFEAMLARLSATFIHLSAGEVDGQIERGLQQIVEFLGIERSSLGQFSADGPALLVTHSYSTPGVPLLPRLNLAPLWPWYTASIRRGTVLRFSRLPDELPPEAAQEREWCFQNAAPRSHLAIPLMVGGTVLGVLGVGSFRRELAWPDDLVQSLRLVGEVFTHALARRRADTALRESEARHRLLLESTQAIPWVADAQTWRMTYVGRQAIDLLGYPLDAWYGEGFWVEHIHPDDREAAVAFCRDHSQTHTDFAFDYRMVAADGRTIWIHDVVNVVVEDGVPRVLRGFMIDMTARRHAEEELRRLREQLTHVSRVTLMGELVASIAHEVNQPLCAIVSNAQALRRMLATGGSVLDELYEALDDIAQDSQRASAVIARVRGFLQKAPPEHAPVDLNDLVREVCQLMRGVMTRRQVAVRLELAEELPVVVGDRVQLQQVLVNLMTNGADAMDRLPDGLRVATIRTSTEGQDFATVAVEDTGAGVSVGAEDLLFDAFFTTKPGNLGMGLAICRSIIGAHGGRIWAEPNASQGATFHFTLPVHPLDPPASSNEMGGEETR
jgi:PAS domain S-box-containing protein